MAIRKIERGHYFEDFEPGQVFEHHWGRTITQGDNSLFTSVTMNFNPAYFNREYAQSIGYKEAGDPHQPPARAGSPVMIPCQQADCWGYSRHDLLRELGDDYLRSMFTPGDNLSREN